MATSPISWINVFDHNNESYADYSDAEDIGYRIVYEMDHIVWAMIMMVHFECRLEWFFFSVHEWVFIFKICLQCFWFSSAYRYPFYAVQWHPEKSPFEWIDKPGMVHSTSAIRACFYTASFFVSEGKMRYLCMLYCICQITSTIYLSFLFSACFLAEYIKKARSLFSLKSYILMINTNYL